ncbi:helix-turn-helix transcriptional regulator [Nocardia asteroides]
MVESPMGEFLRSRRARLRPEDAGLSPLRGRRRVPGLRREELAQLAGVSVDYYIRLEQGRNPNVSDAVLHAVATALRLDEEESEHLFRLARPPKAATGAINCSEVRSGAKLLLDWIAAPAMILGPRMDVLAWNAPATKLITDFGRLDRRERNLARLHMLHPEVSRRYPDQDFIARELVAHLRVARGRYPQDTELTRLIDELLIGSPIFAQQWNLHPVRTKSHGYKRFSHPELGNLTLGFEMSVLPGDSERTLIVYTAAQGTPEAAALQKIARQMPLSNSTDQLETSVELRV